MGTLSGIDPNNNVSFLNAGKPVTGNTGVANPNGPTSPIGSPVPIANPVGPIGNNNGGLLSGNLNLLPSATGNPANGLLTTNPVPVAGYNTGSPSSTVPVNSSQTTPNALGASTLTANQNKQLTDTFGKGTGSLLASEISNLGSDDSSYMQAYEKAMAGTNAENLATLNTTLGNEGISSNSSTAAIENADFEAGVTSQEGLQEQQLQMNDLNQLIGLTESIEAPSVAEVNSGGFLNDLGQVIGDAGSIASDIEGIPSGGGGSVPIGQSSQSGLLGMSNASTAGLQTTDSSISDLI